MTIRSRRRQLVLAATLALAPSLARGQAHTAIKVGQLEMFADEANVFSKTSNTRSQLVQAQRVAGIAAGTKGPGLVFDGAAYYGKPDWGSVIWDPTATTYANAPTPQAGAFKMWMSTSGGGTPVTYSTSRDGVTWDAPSFANDVNGLAAGGTAGYWYGKNANGAPKVYNPHNVLFTGYRNFTTHGQREGYVFPIGGTSVIIDPHKVDGQLGRYKMIFNDMSFDANGNGVGHELYGGTEYLNDPNVRKAGDVGVMTAESADGINWVRSAPITRTATAKTYDAALNETGTATFAKAAIEPHHQSTNNDPLYFKRTEKSVSDFSTLMYDSQKDKFVIYSKGWRWADKPSNPGSLIPNYRTIARLETVQTVAQNPNAFLGDWTEPEVILEPTQRINGVDDPNVAGTAAATYDDAQFMGSSAFEYQGLYFKVLNEYHYQGSFLVKENQQRNADGVLTSATVDSNWFSTVRPDLATGGQKIDLQLAVSRDGKTGWTRIGNFATFLDTGAKDTWDDGILLSYNPTVGPDGKINFFYQGWDGTHDPIPLKPGEPGYIPPGQPGSPGYTDLRTDSGIGLAQSKEGRLLSVSATTGTADVMTKPISFNVDNLQLLINADLAGGDIDVGLNSATNGQFPNFKPVNSVLTAQPDGLYYLVTWNPGRLNLHDLFNKTGRLEFLITGNAKLYGYKFVLPGQFNLSQVPEPTALAALAAVGIAARRRARR